MRTYFHFVNHTSERYGRFYIMWLQRNLFGEWVVVTYRGGRERASVQRCIPVACFEDGLAMMAALAKIRMAHGYVEIQESSQKLSLEDK